MTKTMTKKTNKVVEQDIKLYPTQRAKLVQLIAELCGSEYSETKDGTLYAVDAARVVAVIAKTPEAKKILRMLDKVEGDLLPVLMYKHMGATKVSLEYVRRIIQLFDVADDCLSIQTAKEFPVTFEGQHFRVILAPRVDNADNI